MNIRQLEYLVETLRSGSYVKASEKLFDTPQAVAKSLAELEREYDIELVVKDGRGIKMTPAAREFARQAEDLLQTVADFDRRMRSKSSECCESGHVVLAVEAYEHRAEALDRHALAAFRDRHSAIEVEIMPLLGDSCRSSIGLGMADVAIVLGMQPVEGCTCRKLYSFCPYAALSDSHRLAGKDALSISDLADSTIAVPYNFMCGFSDIKKRLAEEGRAVRFESIAPSAAGHADFLRTGGIVLVSKTSDLPDVISGIRLVPLMRSEGISIPVSLLLPEADITHTPLPVLVQYLVDTSDMLAGWLR